MLAHTCIKMTSERRPAKIHVSLAHPLKANPIQVNGKANSKEEMPRNQFQVVIDRGLGGHKNARIFIRNVN